MNSKQRAIVFFLIFIIPGTTSATHVAIPDSRQNIVVICPWLAIGQAKQECSIDVGRPLSNSKDIVIYYNQPMLYLVYFPRLDQIYIRLNQYNLDS